MSTPITKLIKAFRTMPLREGQEIRVTEMLWGFGIGTAMYRRYLRRDPEVAAEFHSYFEWSDDDQEIVIKYSGDEAKVPELMAALRLCGFAAGT